MKNPKGENERRLMIGDVVQLSPTACRNKAFGACFMVVTDPKPWGAVGYVQEIGKQDTLGGAAFYRAEWNEFELIGTGAWIAARFGEETEVTE